MVIGESMREKERKKEEEEPGFGWKIFSFASSTTTIATHCVQVYVCLYACVHACVCVCVYVLKQVAVVGSSSIRSAS